MTSQDAARVLAEGTLHLIGVWVGRNDERADVHGCVVSIQAGLAPDRLVVCCESGKTQLLRVVNHLRVCTSISYLSLQTPHKNSMLRGRAGSIGRVTVECFRIHHTKNVLSNMSSCI